MPDEPQLSLLTFAPMIERLRPELRSVRRYIAMTERGSMPALAGVDCYEDLLAAVRPGVDGLLLEAGPYRSTLLPSVWPKIRGVEELNLPPVKIHCSVLAEDAIRAAIGDWKKKQEAAKPEAVAAK